MDWQGSRSRTWFARFAWALLVWNIPVILWGAYVRVSFSGDGCGAHWPFCNGYVIPQQMARPMLIEFTHRLMTSVDSVGAMVLCIWAFAAYLKGHAVRRYALLSLLFLFVEALLGAGLVLFRKVAHDQSAGRAIYLSAHLTNTMLLLGAITITAWLAQRDISRITWTRISRAFAWALAITVAVSITGSIAALGDMLFPATSLSAGLAQDFASTSHFLLRLRLFHPVLAIAGAGYLLWTATKAMRNEEDSPARAAGIRVMFLIVLQVLAGLVNFTLLAPLWMQMTHLLLADVLWIAVVVMVMETARTQRDIGETGILITPVAIAHS